MAAARSARFGKSHSLRQPAHRALQNILEQLEARQLLSAATGIVPATQFATIHPHAGAAFAGFTPAQIRKAYGFDQITGDGTGQTIAISDAFMDPTIAADLQTFDAHFGLSNPVLTVLNENGRTDFTGYTTDPTGGWTVETALDVEWAHVVAPGAKIVLVEAIDATNADLMATVNTARYLAGVSVISMSWGGAENPGGFGNPSDQYYDRFMLTPATHQPETFIASSGDNGVADASWPATSPYVLSVGGTNLKVDSSNNYTSEGVWIGSQGGESLFERTPAYQASVSKTLFRSTPDVSYDADPNTGVIVYNSTPATDPNVGDITGYQPVGGTSAGAPQWAGFIAVVNQMRVANGLATLDGPNNTLPALYSLALGKKTRYQSAFNDIATGQNGDTITAFLPTNPIPLNTVPNPHGGGYTGFAAKPGWDMVTGLGTPKVPTLSAYLAQYVPVKRAHRSPRQRALSAALTSANAAAVKPTNTQILGAAVLFGDATAPITPPVVAPAAPAAVSSTLTPAAYAIKSITGVSHGIDRSILSATESNITTTAAAISPINSRSLTADGSHVVDSLHADDAVVASSAVPPTVTGAAPLEPAALFETTLSDYVTVPCNAETGFADALAAQVKTATAKVRATVTDKPAHKTIGLKQTIPMMLGVAAADAMLVSKWVRTRAAKKRNARSPFSFGPITPNDDEDTIS